MIALLFDIFAIYTYSDNVPMHVTVAAEPTHVRIKGFGVDSAASGRLLNVSLH